MIDGDSKAAVVIVPERHEAEGLQHPRCRFARRTEDFGHALHWAGFCLKGNLNEIALAQGLSHVEQPAGDRNCLEFSSCASAIF
jgi:hypothetical protein